MNFESASPQGTQSLRVRFPLLERNKFYRTAQGLTLSSLGIGTYLGPINDETDRGYTSSIRAALRQGINVIDTSLNYRHQQSERAIGRALESLLQSGEITRGQIVLCSKAGYLVPQAIPTESLLPGDVVGKTHCLAPAFLTDQIKRSLHNLRVSKLDVFYLHNPETQLAFMDETEFYKRIRIAFATCEELVAAGKTAFYGIATWDGLRRRPGGSDGIQLARLVALAREVGGAQHHFRFAQLPFNYSMAEAISARNQLNGERPPVPLVEAADAFGITVIGSATLLQGRLANGLPEEFLNKFSDLLPTQAQRAIQFARSTPGLTTSLIGMSKPERVSENMKVAGITPFTDTEYYSFFKR